MSVEDAVKVATQAAEALEVKPEAAQAPSSDTKAEPAPAPAPAPAPEAKQPADTFSKRFDALVKKEEDIRQREAALKSAARVPPALVANLIKAAEGGDVEGALKLLGFKPEQLKSKAAPAEQGEPSAVEQRIEALERQLQEREREVAKQQVVGMVTDKLKGSKLANIGVMGAEAPGLVLAELERMWAAGGGRFDMSVDEVIEAAAGIVNERLETERQRWLKALTPQNATGTVSDKATETAGGAGEKRTMHNGLAVGTAGTADPVAAAIEVVRNSIRSV